MLYSVVIILFHVESKKQQFSKSKKLIDNLSNLEYAFKKDQVEVSLLVLFARHLC
jgi:hypothetical protein